MRKILLVPTWLLMIVISPFLSSSHPFYDAPSYDSWCKHATETNVILGCLIWLSNMYLIIFAVIFFSV